MLHAKLGIVGIGANAPPKIYENSGFLDFHHVCIFNSTSLYTHESSAHPLICFSFVIGGIGRPPTFEEFAKNSRIYSISKFRLIMFEEARQIIGFSKKNHAQEF